MSRDRFDLIWRFLHLSNNNQPNNNDKLSKLRFFLDYLNRKFKEVYKPNAHMTVDESMVPFKGRLGFKQYMPAKPVKWGIKVWSLCESATGYLYNFQIYIGAEGQAEHGLSYRVVMDLCVCLANTFITVVFDNFYTSCELLKNLLIRGIYACGTIRQNRKGLPQELRNPNQLQKHQYRCAQQDDLTFVVWKDTYAYYSSFLF